MQVPRALRWFAKGLGTGSRRARSLARRATRGAGRQIRSRRGGFRWAIRVSAPNDPSAARWGDTAFALDLVDALERAGQTARVVYLGADDPDPDDDDVVLVLRGLHRIRATVGALNYLWVISHPDSVTREEVEDGWARVFAASASWRKLGEFGAETLLQAASARRFAPGPADPGLAEDVLFVGTTRHVLRPVIRDVVAAGAQLGVYGHDWEDFLSPDHIRGDHLEFHRVPGAYRSARIVLNDHWEDMRREGFLSNRLFDATFAGASVISDEIDGLDGIFSGLVQTYRTKGELDRLLSEPTAWPTPQERAETIASLRRDHSFDARAAHLIARARGDFRRHRRTSHF